LSDAGNDKMLFARAQKLAAVPEERFESMGSEWRARVLPWRPAHPMEGDMPRQRSALSACRGFLYLLARLLGDVQAVRKGTVGKLFR
jgi:hypothetical protein